MNDKMIVLDAQGGQKQYLKDLYRYQELFYFLGWRDVLVRYKQTFFGVAWAILRPLLNMLAFALIFGKIAHLSSPSVSYPFFVFAGLLPWQMLASTIADGSLSMINNQHMISKVYFPRVLIPCATLWVNFIDFLISFSLLLSSMLVLGKLPGWPFLIFPFIFAWMLILCSAISLWLSALVVRFRDFRFVIPFFVQCGMFFSPIGYETSLIPFPWHWLYCLNPLVGIIDAFRWSLFEISHSLIAYSVTVSLLVTIFLLIVGFQYFRRIEKICADIL